MRNRIQMTSAFFLIFFGSASLYSQPYFQWGRIYNGPANEDDVAHALKVDNSGNVYVTGSSQGVGTDYDYCTIKYNSNGDSLWVRRWNSGPGYTPDGGRDLLIDNAGSVYVTGVPVTIKYDASGSLIWTLQNNALGKIILMNLQGFIYVLAKGVADPWILMKLDTAGTTIWRKTYNAGWGQPYDMALDKFGNIIAVGSTGGPGWPNYYDFCVIKYNSQGDSLWRRTYGGPPLNSNFEAAYAVAVDSSGNIYATGESVSNGTSNYIIIKYAPNGDSLWTRRFNIGGSAAYDIAMDNEGSAYVTGVTSVFNYTTIKYSPSGQLLWQQTIPGLFPPPWNRLTIDNFNNLYVAASNDHGWGNMVIAKYNPAGVQQWIVEYPNFSNSAGVSYDIVVDLSSNVHVTGDGQLGSGQQNQGYLTVKYSQTVGIKPVTNEMPDEFRLYQNSPNPFNPSTRIAFDVSNRALVELVIYDITGRIVNELVKQELNRGRYSVQWFPDPGISSGIYLYKLEVNGLLIAAKKMLYIK